MWLSEQMKFGGERPAAAAETGQVSMGGASIAVVTQGERRGLSLALPGGFRWRPALGQRVLVLHSEDGEEIVAGVLTDTGAGLENGELEIQGEKCSIRLDRRGRITISGQQVCLTGGVEISGGLTVDGEPYIPCKCTGGLL